VNTRSVQSDTSAHFQGVKQQERGINQPPLLGPRLKKVYSYNSAPLWAFMISSRWKYTFIFY